MPKKLGPNRTKLFSNPMFLTKRELGFRKKLGFEDDLCKKLIESYDEYHSAQNTETGGIFNLEFSQTG